ncbi:YcaO-like family protein [Bacillus thuringiensis]|uniref:YcaO-like family protein n=1 Tax=Bacillus thuringiensis TaxID=1428 RepID=UPI000BFE4F7A|nr:YcaO-like family protein [Bacillus thuringiensis]PGW31659.1 bacteriocin biosynthesis protein SagD [Bacillus thuringiensis]
MVYIYIWERETSIQEAYHKAVTVIQQLGLSYEKNVIGDTIYTTHITLRNAQNEVVSSGTGKGLGGTSEIGALFEALEHYYTEKDALQNCRTFPSHRIPTIETFNHECIIQLLHTEKNEALLCREYNSLKKSKQNVWYPLFITNPYYAENVTHPDDYFNYKKLKRYSSNSGIAIGSTFYEALIHATNEVIERDAWSLFLLNHYYYQNKSVLQIMDINTFSNELKTLMKNAVSEIGENITLLNITTETNIPTILAVSSNENIPYVGLGTSLYLEYAITRAITEFVQTCHMTRVFPEQASEERVAILEALKEYPQHYRCAEFHTQRLWDTESKYVSFDSICSFPHQSLEKYMQELEIRLNDCGFDIYYSILNSFDNDIHIVNALIPNMERFFLNYEGYFVLPSNRGHVLNQ